MFKPDVPLTIMRSKNLTQQQKAFLLWCWSCRDTDDRCDLISKTQGCNLRYRNITWYANFFGVVRQQLSRAFSVLRKLDIIKTRKNSSGSEVTYVDFTVFKGGNFHEGDNRSQ